MRISIFIVVLGTLLFSFETANSQDLEVGQVLPDLSQEQKLDRLQSNFNAFTAVFIAFAKEKGYSVEDVGTWAGKQFAKSWGEELTPEGFVRGMNSNWQMFSIKTKILEVDPSHVKAERGMVMPRDMFNKQFANYGITLDEYQTYFAHALKAITAKYGITYSESANDSTITFVVSSNE